jgi:hypothetical protein
MSFDHWQRGAGSPFELLVPETKWTIVGVQAPSGQAA